MDKKKVKKIKKESLDFSGFIMIFFIGIISTLFLLLTSNNEISSDRNVFEIEISSDTIGGQATKSLSDDESHKNVLCTCFFDSKKYYSVFIEVNSFSDCWNACSVHELPFYVEYVIS